MQAAGFERLSLDASSLSQDGFVTAEVDVRRRDIVPALVISPMIVVVDEGCDLGFEIAGQEVVFQEDAVLQGLMPSLDFTLRLRVIRRTTRVLHAFALQPISQIICYVTGAIIAEQRWLVDDVNLIAARCL